MKKLTPFQTNLLIIFGAALLFIPFLGNVHLFDWDEINFAESAREMLLTENYFTVQIDFQPFWEKPPFFIWLQALSMSVFGVNEFAARFPNAICGIITLPVIYNIGTRHYGQKLGLLWVLAYIGSFLPHFYFKSGIIDPWFNLFIFLGIYFLAKAAWNRRSLPALLSGAFIGLAVLTKGPVGLLIPLLCLLVYWGLSRIRSVLSVNQLIMGALAVFLVSFVWYGVETIKNGFWFLQEFIVYQIRLLRTQDAGHGGPFFYHFVVLLIGCFPASVFLLFYFIKKRKEAFKKPDAEDFGENFHKWMSILFWVVLILFSIVQTKIVHYSSLAYFPLTFIAARYLHSVKWNTASWSKGISWLIAILGGLVAIALMALPLLIKNKEQFIPYIKDPFAVANLQAEVHWSGWEGLNGVVLLAGVIACSIFFNKQKYIKGSMAIFIATAVTLQLTLIVVVPKIEGYSQRAAIEFFKSKQNEDAYVQVLGYKSYAHLFYTRKKPQQEIASDKEWLLHGQVGKPVYFVTKVDRLHRYRQHEQLKEIGEKNGFVFLKREY